MSSPRWIGGSPTRAQVTIYQFGSTWEADDIIRATIGNVSIDFVAGATLAGDVADNLAAAWVLLDSTLYPQFTKLTATVANTNEFTLTGPDTGEPFTVTLTPLESDGSPSGGQKIDGITTATTGNLDTSPRSPNDWSVAANWDTGAVPVSTDTPVIEETDVPIYWGFAQTAVTLASLTIRNLLPGFQLGLPKTNADGYPEYLADYLAIKITALEIDDDTADRIKIDLSSAASTVRILNTGNGEDDLGAVQLKGSSITSIEILGGSLDVARYSGETATVTTLRNAGGTVFLGSGTSTITTGALSGGTTTSYCAFTTLTVGEQATCYLRGTAQSGTVHTDGTLYMLDTAGASTLLAVDGGTCFYRSGATIASLQVNSRGRFQRDNDLRAIDCEECIVTADYALTDSAGTINWITGIGFDRCQIRDGELDVRTDFQAYFSPFGVTPPPASPIQTLTADDDVVSSVERLFLNAATPITATLANFAELPDVIWVFNIGSDDAYVQTNDAIDINAGPLLTLAPGDSVALVMGVSQIYTH